MAKPTFRDVDGYISAKPEATQAVLKRVRSAIQNALPGSQEVISYGIPAYRLAGTIVVYFAGWKEHYSLYPAGERLVAEFMNQLAPYKISKGTIRFPLSEPVPVGLIKRIAKFRLKESSARR